MVADADANTAYAPTYYDETVSLPAAEGVYGKEIHSTKPIAVQITEAQLFLDLIKTQNPTQYAQLAKTSAPMPVLVKVPGEGRVKMLLGVAPYEADPFITPKPTIDGKFLALKDDIDDPKEAPTVITFDDTVFTFAAIMAPTREQFVEKILKKDDKNDGALWFKQAKVATTTVQVAKLCPIPAVYAYDALMDAVPAHVLWERIKMADLQNNEDLRSYILDFLQAAHTDHNASNTAIVDMGTNPFMARQHKDAKQWAKEKAAKLFGSVRVAGTVAAALPASPAGLQAPAQDFQKLAEAMIAIQVAGSPAKGAGNVAIVADTDATLFKTYGLCPLDLERMLTMCGLQSGQEDRLPAWITTVATTNLSKEGRRAAVRKALLSDLKYDEHPIPITPQLIKMIMDKEFTGDDDHTTAGGAMKGLSPYLMASMTAEELEEAADYAQALEESRSATVAEIRRKNTRKAQAPIGFTDLLDISKTYANLLLVLCGRRCPMLQETVRDIIIPLQKFSQMARRLMAKTTLASILWAMFKQGCQFTLGQMEEDGDRTAEWDTAVTMIRSKSDFALLEVPLAIKGVPAIITPATGKRKERESNDESKKPDIEDTTKSPKKPRQERYDGRNLPVHKVIQAKLTAALPDRFQMRMLTAACNIKELEHVFPEAPNLCLHVALRGWCPFYRTCKKKHDPSVITDTMAENVINLFDPFIKNPKILDTKGK